MTRLCVEVGFGFTVTDSPITWTDITRFVDIQSHGISVDNRGASDELSETQATTCGMVLDNSDGRFTPDRPDVKKNVPIRWQIITADRNLVTNPTFETDTTGWSSSGTPSIIRSTAQSQQGSASMRITWGAVSSQSVRTTVYGLDIGTTYTASAYVRVPAGDQAVRLKMATAASGGADFAFGPYSTLLDTWQRITCTFVAAETSLQLRINPNTPTGAGDLAYVDAVQVEEGPAATTFDPNGAQLHPRFFGMVNQWPTTWHGLYSMVTINCTDVFKRLSRADALRPMLIQEVLLDGPLAYYPMGEGSDSTSAGDESGLGPSALAIRQTGSGGTLEFGGSAGPADSLGAPTFTPADLVNGKYLAADLGGDFQSQSSQKPLFVECWFSTLTRGRNILTVASANEGYYLIFLLGGATGRLTIESRDPATGVDTSVVGATDLADGTVHHLLYDEQNRTVYIDGTLIGSTPTTRGTAGLRRLHVGASQNGNNVWQGSVSHVALYADTLLTAAQLTTHYTTGTTVHSGETADARIARLASYVGMTAQASGTVFSPVEKQVALGSSALEHMREVERTEAGRLLSSRSSAAIVLQSRSVRYSPVPAFTVHYADLDTKSVELADDDQKLTNTVQMSRPTGATVRLVNTVSRDANGPYEKSLELFTTTDEAMTDRGNWILSRYADPPPELRTVPLEASTLGLDTYRAILGADVSTAFTITSLPAEAPAALASCTVEGYTETITHNQHKISFYASRTDLDTRWVLNDTTYSVLGSTTRLGF